MAKITEYARALYDANDDKAEAEAAHKARQHEDAGETEEAETLPALPSARVAAAPTQASTPPGHEGEFSAQIRPSKSPPSRSEACG
jgi:hypothetical protein